MIELHEITKIKIYAEHATVRSFRIKINHFNYSYYIGAALNRTLNELPEHFVWFAKIINAKLIREGIELNKISLDNMKISGAFIEGVIYKRSKYWKEWGKRYVVINCEGLFSYKNYD
jgi:hypothetical protein